MTRFSSLVKGAARRTFSKVQLDGAHAAVSPGYDDTKLTGRDVHYQIDRRNGGVYDDQWKAAIDTAADWVIVTSWNEWWKNTEIKPSEQYGTTFLDRTRVWTSVFKR